MMKRPELSRSIARLSLAACLALAILTACAPGATPAAAPTPTGPSTLNVMTHDSFAVSEDLVRAFEADNNAKLTFIKSGDTGAALNRAILTKSSPQADVFYGVDSTFLSRALAEDIFDSYASPKLADIPAAFQLDSSQRALPVDYGDVCINYDRAYFSEKNLAVPQSLEDLAKPEYAGLLAVENPATSSPGLAFLLATIAHFGPDQYLAFWEQLKANQVQVVNDWEGAYYTNFSGSSGKGPQPMVVSYASSPAAEMIFADPKPVEPPTASILAPGTCFRQVEFVGILKGTAQRSLAEKFVDFMLDTAFQEDMPMQMFVYPVNSQAKLPAEFEQFAQVAEQPAALDAAEIAKNREAWIQAWTEAVLR
jgi:thiamine transport system substrate-binding protein